MSFNFTVTVPGGVSAPPPGNTIAGFMSTSAAAHRESLRASHTIGIGEKGFIGFASRSGFSTLVVSSATDLVTAINGMAPTDKILFKCQWNGISTPATAYVSGTSNADMVANGAVDWGFTRPAWSVIIEPATGYAPKIGMASGGTDALIIRGTHWHEINNMVFTGTVVFEPSVGYRDGIAIVALKGCTFEHTLVVNGIRTLHMDGCTTKGSSTDPYSQAIINTTANYTRVWNHTAVGHTNALDFIHNFAYSSSYQTNWIAHSWIAGVKLLKMIPVTSGNHFDFHQYAIYKPEVGVMDIHKGYRILHEFNVVNGNAADSQGMFIAQAVAGQQNAICVHNCIMAVNAFWAYGLADPSGSQKCIVDRVLCLRGGIGPGPDHLIVQGVDEPTFDSAPWMGLYGNNVNAGGSMEITNSYFFKQASGEVQNNGVTVPVTVSGNIHINPLLNAANADKPHTLLTGPWTSEGTNANGFYSYTSPDIAISDPVAAAAAFTAFVKPKAGWGVNAGPLDPASWPTDFNQTIT